jgi:hypothetical protein
MSSRSKTNPDPVQYNWAYVLNSHDIMALSETISTQIPIPSALYQAIAQRAKAQGNSITHEILHLLSGSLEMDTLTDEIALWEAASDEDYLSFEATLTEGVC